MSIWSAIDGINAAQAEKLWQEKYAAADSATRYLMISDRAHAQRMKEIESLKTEWFAKQKRLSRSRKGTTASSKLWLAAGVLLIGGSLIPPLKWTDLALFLIGVASLLSWREDRLP